MSDGSAGVLLASGLCKSYGQGVSLLSILTGLDLEVREGEIVAIVGPSGSGKSTLLHVLGALDPPDEGRVLVMGRDIWALSERERSRVRNLELGFVFQFHHLLEEFTLAENVALPAMFAGRPRQQCMDSAMELLDSVGLTDRAHHSPSRVSGGDRQRAAVARALICSPCVVLADEPTGNLDSENSEQLRLLIWRLARDRKQSFVVATHNLELAARADRTLSLRAGRLES